MRTLARLLSALGALFEEAVEAGLVRELAIRWRLQRLEAAERALEAANQRRAAALRDGDHAALAVELADLERALDDAGVPDA